MAKRSPVDRRVVLRPDEFGPHEILALSKICGPGSSAVVAARKLVAESRVYPVDVTVRVVGDIEVGVPELVPDKFDYEKYLVAALAALPAEKRQAVLRRPVVRRSVAAAVVAELDEVKARRRKRPGPAKITPHLTVTRVGGYAPQGARQLLAEVV